MDTSKIITKSKRALFEDGYAYDANLGPWESIDEYVSFMLDTVGLSSIKPGTHIQVYEKSGTTITGKVIEYMYDASKTGSAAWVIVDTKNTVRFGGLIESAGSLLATTTIPCDSTQMYWSTTSKRFVFLVGSKYYGVCPNMKEFCDTDGKPYNDVIYINGTSMYVNVDGVLSMATGGGGSSTADVNALISAALNNYNKTAAAGIELRTINNAKHLALVNNSGDVMSSVSISDLDISVITSVAKPTILVSNNVCSITSEVEGAKIYYSYDSDPVVNESNLYLVPFEIEFDEMEDEVDIKAIAVKNGVKSEVTSFHAEYVELVSKPKIVQTDNTISITCTTANAVIYYTTDGSNPDNTSTVYKGGVGFTEDKVIKAIAYSGNNKSMITRFNFVHTGGTTTTDVAAPFVVATWNTGRWSLGTNQYSTVYASTADSFAAKTKKALRKANNGELPDVLFTQETNETFTQDTGLTTDNMVFDEFENKIHPNASNAYVYGRSRNAIYTKHMTAITAGSGVDTFKNPPKNIMSYYTVSLATISGKQVALVSTHFPTVATSDTWANKKLSAEAQQKIAQKMIADLASYPYVIIGADFNAMEFSLMPPSDDPWGDLTPQTSTWDARAYYPCGFATAGYHCASGAEGTYNKLINSETGVKKDLLINGSGTTWRIVDNILVKGLTITSVGRVYVGSGENDVDDNTQLSDHSILYCTVQFNS